MKAKILVVDDEKNILEMLKKYLARKGYSVTASNTGEDGIEKAKKSKYSLAIIDIVMPGMDGIETIKTIEKLDDKIRFLIITGYSITGEVSDLIEGSKRVHGYIFKPFNLEHLGEKIEEILKNL